MAAASHDHRRRNFESVTIIGSGVMGRAIAVACASRGVRAVLYDSDSRALENAMHEAKIIVTRLAKLGEVSNEQRTAALISAQGDLHSAVAPSPLIIESVPEELKLKSAVFSQLDALCPKEILLATNTSGLSVTEIANSTNHPERVVGLHFFAPAYILKTVEIVPGAKTSTETLRAAAEFAQDALGKVPITLTKDVPNFLVNTLQFAMLREARRLLEEGVVASMEELDLAVMHSVPLRQLLFGLFEDSDLISPYSSLTHPGRKDLKTNYAYEEPGEEVLARRDELLLALERAAEKLRARRPKVVKS